MIASERTAATSSGVISGSGLAIAKMIGLAAIDAIISGLTAPFWLRPRNRSAPTIASARVRASVTAAWADFHWFMPSVRPAKMTPLVSHMTTSRTPSSLISSVQAMALAPAPLTTILISLALRPVRWSALIRPAAAMIAVPCWSSWKTGMFIRSFSVVSTMKHSGALMSSRLMPPKLGSISSIASISRSTSSVFSSMSIESMSAKRLNRTALPSITGFDASAPRLPRPRIAVPFEMTATRLPLIV